MSKTASSPGYPPDHKTRNAAARAWVHERLADVARTRELVYALVASWPALSTAGRELRGVPDGRHTRRTLGYLGDVVRRLRRREWRVGLNRVHPTEPATEPVLYYDERTDGVVLTVNLAKLLAHADHAALSPGGLSALAVIYEHRSQRPSGRMRPILPRVMVEQPAAGTLPVLGPYRMRRMPLLPEVDEDDVRPAILELVDASGLPFRSRGRAAALEAALLVEAMFDLEINDRTGLISATIPWTVGGLKAALKPNGARRSSAKRAGDWPRIAAALRAMDGASVPFVQPSGRVDWFRVFRTHLVPGADAPDTDVVTVTLALPPGAGPGPVMDRAAVRKARLVSSVAWRAMIGVYSAAWVKGRTRRPLGAGKGGRWSGDPDRYPVLSADDRRRIGFGEGTKHFPGHIDKEWRKRAKEAGVVIVDEDAVEERTGKPGWRVVPTEAAEVIRRRRGDSDGGANPEGG